MQTLFRGSCLSARAKNFGEQVQQNCGSSITSAGGEKFWQNGSVSRFGRFELNDQLVWSISPSSRRQVRKQRRCHSGREFLEQPHRPLHVAVAEMDQRKVLGAEAPFRHDFDEPSVAHQLGLYDRR